MPQTRRRLQRVRDTTTVTGAPQRGQRSGSAGGAGGGCIQRGSICERQPSKASRSRPLYRPYARSVSLAERDVVTLTELRVLSLAELPAATSAELQMVK